MTAKELIEEIMRACGGNYEREVTLKVEHSSECPECGEEDVFSTEASPLGAESHHPNSVEILI